MRAQEKENGLISLKNLPLFPFEPVKYENLYKIQELTEAIRIRTELLQEWKGREIVMWNSQQGYYRMASDDRVVG